MYFYNSGSLEPGCLCTKDEATPTSPPTAPSENENLYQGEELFSFHFCLLSRYKTFLFGTGIDCETEKSLYYLVSTLESTLLFLLLNKA